jgi:DNA-directed RNA polymerase subunit RPC12/RpoP
MTNEDKELIADYKEENRRLIDWVNDLQSGMYINCVYCGHRYGHKKNTPATMADILKQHIEKCPKHPMSHLKRENRGLKAENQRQAKEIERFREVLEQYANINNWHTHNCVTGPLINNRNYEYECCDLGPEEAQDALSR